MYLLNDENITRFAQIIPLVYGFMLSFIVPLFICFLLQKRKVIYFLLFLTNKKESLYLTTSLFFLLYNYSTCCYLQISF